MTRDEQEALYEENENLAYYVIRNMISHERVTEDLIQIAKVGLWQAVLGYDPSMGEFSTYAIMAIKNELRAHLKHWTRQMRTPPGNAPNLSLDCMPKEDRNGREFSGYRYFHTAAPPISIWIGPRPKEIFTDRMLAIIRLFADGAKSNREVGDQLGLSHETVRKEVIKIRAIFEENMISIN